MRLLVVGAGGHGRVVADAAESIGSWKEIVFADDRFPEMKASGRWNVIGSLRNFEDLLPERGDFVVAVGSAALRLSVLERGQQRGLRSPCIVHPRAFVSSDVSLGDGTVVLAGAVINTGAKIGRASIINSGAVVEHDCQLGDGVHVCPGACIAGEVAIGPRCWVGIGAVIRQCLSLESDVTLGAGAVCVASIRSAGTYVGNPARLVRGE